MERCQSLAQRAVKADREGNLAAASQLYLEAAQSLQVIPGGEQRYLSHITQYLNRHQEIQVELHRQNGHRPQEGEPANAEAHCIVDPSKLCVMEGMGLSTAACREGLLRFDNDLERATDWVFNNPGWHPSPQSPEHSHVPSNSSSRPSPSPNGSPWQSRRHEPPHRAGQPRRAAVPRRVAQRDRGAAEAVRGDLGDERGGGVSAAISNFSVTQSSLDEGNSAWQESKDIVVRGFSISTTGKQLMSKQELGTE